jgi:hypothetical protein
MNFGLGTGSDRLLLQSGNPKSKIAARAAHLAPRKSKIV